MKQPPHPSPCSSLPGRHLLCVSLLQLLYFTNVLYKESGNTYYAEVICVAVHQWFILRVPWVHGMEVSHTVCSTIQPQEDILLLSSLNCFPVKPLWIFMGKLCLEITFHFSRIGTQLCKSPRLMESLFLLLKGTDKLFSSLYYFTFPPALQALLWSCFSPSTAFRVINKHISYFTHSERYALILHCIQGLMCRHAWLVGWDGVSLTSICLSPPYYHPPQLG
jgi:hypothetical protein